MGVSHESAFQLSKRIMAAKIWSAKFAAVLALLTCANLTFVAPLTRAAVTVAWAQRYHGPSTNSDFANAMAVDADGNVVVTGSSNNGTNGDYYTAKYAAADGTLLWEKRYNGPANGQDYANAVAVDGNGNVVVTGSSHNGTDLDYYTAKYAAADGALLWEQRYNHSAYGDDEAFAVALDGSGNVVVTGYSCDATIIDVADYYTAKYAAADGALLWEKRYHGPVAASFDHATAVAVDSSGNVVVTGYSGTVKYAAADGALVWKTRNNIDEDDDDHAKALALDGSGNAVVTGHAPIPYNQSYTAKYAATNGALLWKKFGPQFGPGENALALDGSGNAVVTGYSTAKYAAADGSLLWEATSNGSGEASAVAVDANGDAVVAWNYYDTAKYAAADGALLWKRHDIPYKLGSHCLALGPNGMVVVTGGYSEGNGRIDFETVVYRENLPAVSIALVPTGVRLSFPGVAGHSYQVLRAPAVTGPWSTNATTIAVTNGIIEYIDTNAPPGSAFYRTAAAP